MMRYVELTEFDRPSEGIDLVMSYMETGKVDKYLKKEEEEEMHLDGIDELDRSYEGLSLIHI
eukprot:11194723-Alexandrium_andersonii.AAC.1